jgi:hypothetical protein
MLGCRNPNASPADDKNFNRMIDHERTNKYDNDYHSIIIERGQMNISMNAWLLGKPNVI